MNNWDFCFSFIFEKVVRGVGRPKKADEDVKRHRVDIRMTDKTKDKLNRLSYETGRSKTEVIEKALELYEFVNDEVWNMDK